MLAAGVLMLAVGLGMMAGDCASYDTGGQGRSTLRCSPNGDGSISADLAGGVVAAVGVVVLLVCCTVIALDWRSDSRRDRRRGSRRRRPR